MKAKSRQPRQLEMTLAPQSREASLLRERQCRGHSTVGVARELVFLPGKRILDVVHGEVCFGRTPLRQIVDYCFHFSTGVSAEGLDRTQSIEQHPFEMRQRLRSPLVK